MSFTSGLSNGPKKHSKAWQLCYMNSILQALCPLLWKWIPLELKSNVKSKSKSFLLATFLQFMIEEEEPLDPRSLLSILDAEKKTTFQVGLQNESHAFYLFLMNEIENTEFQKHFDLTYRIALQCTECGHTHYQSESFDSNRLQSKTKNIMIPLSDAPRVTTLNELLLDIATPIEVEGKCTYDGPFGCQTGPPRIFQKFDRLIAPVSAIVILLDRTDYQDKKKRNAVYFGEEQDFFVYQYDPNLPLLKIRKTLYAVIVHLGKRGKSGHFITLAKHPMTQKWWKYDDDKVSPSSFAEVSSYNKEITMLFYDSSP